jgi:hypothetical protein
MILGWKNSIIGSFLISRDLGFRVLECYIKVSSFMIYLLEFRNPATRLGFPFHSFLIVCRKIARFDPRVRSITCYHSDVGIIYPLLVTYIPLSFYTDGVHETSTSANISLGHVEDSSVH